MMLRQTISARQMAFDIVFVFGLLGTGVALGWYFHEATAPAMTMTVYADDEPKVITDRIMSAVAPPRDLVSR